MRFKLPRDRTIASTCGLSICFKKGEFQLVPPDMYAEVIAAGGVSEEEFPEDEAPAPVATPASAAAREEAIFAAYDRLVLRKSRGDFTAGGSPHPAALSKETGWPVDAKERDTTWTKYQSRGE